MFTVPADKYLVVNYYTHGTGRIAGAADIQILAQIRLNAGESGEGWRAISSVFDYQNNFTNNASYTVLPPKTDARIKIISTASTQSFAVVGGYEVKTTSL